MSWLLNLSIGIVVFVVIFLGVIVLIRLLSKDDQEQPDDPISINFLSHLTDGRFMGPVLNTKHGKDGRVVMTMLPKDIKPIDIDIVKTVDIIAYPHQIVDLPKGLLSRDRNVKLILAKNPDDYPESLKESQFGKLLMLHTAFKDADFNEIRAFKEGMKRQGQHIKSMGAGELSSERLVYLESQFEDYLDAVIKGMKKGEKSSSSTFTPPTRPEN